MIILRGLPGSGKSTVAEYIVQLNGAVICCADDYFMKDGEYKWNPALLGSAHNWCKNLCEGAMKNGENVIVANTNTTDSELKPYLDMSTKYGYRVFSMIVENRHGNSNIHNVPSDSLDKMKNRFSVKL